MDKEELGMESSNVPFAKRTCVEKERAKRPTKEQIENFIVQRCRKKQQKKRKGDGFTPPQPNNVSPFGK
jgi:hypothetical protein